jgi:large subunit ribosomal protein L17
MRHRVAGRKLNIDTQHRLALRRNLSRSLFLHGRIVTGVTKAKYVRPFAERLITRARKAIAARDAGQKARWLHLVRLLEADVKDREVLTKLLSEVAPRANRPGGYTRIVHDWRRRVGDSSPLAVFELVDRAPTETDEEADAGAEEKPAKGKKPAAAKTKAKAGAAKPKKGAAAEAKAE